ncbi:MAG: HD-GYP domain-containing protein [Eubacteriales bacterium]|nr:HD-GYP domain-containing protein [Eubacteriales bacterium]MDD4422243.1 HD-GYP domain-containing protein [Eubacteriales bacterium]
MRFVQSTNLKPGMVLAKNIYGIHGELLLAMGSELTEKFIEKLLDSECDGAYIADDSVEDSGVKGIISTKLKENTVRAVRSFFIGIEKNNTFEARNSLSSMKNLLEDIIDEISTDKNAMVNMVDLKVFDDYTYYHCVSVAGLAIMVGVSAGMNRKALYKLGMGALLHDVGKIFIPKEILNKNGPLTKSEFEIMKKHSRLGSDYLKRQNALPLESVIAVLTHHERYDSKGYPLGLPHNKQTIEGKIIAICDNFDAMTSDRPYRPAFSPSEAIEHIMGNAGIMFDPSILNLFIKKIVPYPIGTIVNLSNGKRGVVVENYPNSFMRPKIRIVSSENNGGKEEIYDLCNNPELLNVTVIGLHK